MTDTKPPLDLDALLAIVRRRTPGTLPGSILAIGISNECDRAAIVTAVNDFEQVAERCKRADVTIAALTCQRDELLAALKDIANECPINNDIRLKVIAALNSVKGGADGKA